MSLFMIRRNFGFFLVIIGLVMVVGTTPIITGNVVLEDVRGLGAVRILGIVFLIAGLLILATATRERTSGLEKELEKPLPGKGIKGDYIPLSDILNKKHLVSNKVSVDLIGDKIYRDGRLVQGLSLKGDYVEFTGYHFTTSDAAKIIQDDQALEIKNFMDPYVYLLESMSYSGMGEKTIRHMVGASAAQEAVIVNVRYPVDKIYLKFEIGRPTHYAVNGDIERENLLIRNRTLVVRKRLEDL